MGPGAGSNGEPSGYTRFDFERSMGVRQIIRGVRLVRRTERVIASRKTLDDGIMNESGNLDLFKRSVPFDGYGIYEQSALVGTNNRNTQDTREHRRSWDEDHF